MRRTKMQTIPEAEVKKNIPLYAITFLAFGIVAFVVSILFSSPMICFVGLGLILWGTLFLLIVPQKHVEVSLLISTALPDYMTIDNMLKDFESCGIAYYISSHQEDLHLSDSKGPLVFIPTKLATRMTTTKDLIKADYLVDDSKAIVITPPGMGILDKVELESKTVFANTPVNELCEILPYFFIRLNLAEEIELRANEENIVLEINGSLYKNLYDEKYDLQSIKLLGCPLVSAFASAFAESIGKPVSVKEIKVDSKSEAIVAIFNTIEARVPPLIFEYQVAVQEGKPAYATRQLVQENVKRKKKERITRLPVTDAQILDNNINFYALKGIINKRLVITKKIPINEITNIENKENELIITWKNQTDRFLNRGNAELFSNLNYQVDHQRKRKQVTKRDIKPDTQRRKELLGVINASIGVVDFAYDVLIALHEKSTNWQYLIDNFTKDIVQTLSLKEQTLPSLNLDFQNVSLAIKSQNAEETSKEAHNILAIIQAYFDGLNIDDDSTRGTLNVSNAKAIVSSYYSLNDLLLSKAVGESINTKSYSKLESALKILAGTGDFTGNVLEINRKINELDSENTSKIDIFGCRKMLKEIFLSFVTSS
jgi:hypothetical protein